MSQTALLHCYDHIFAFATLATHSASVVKSNFFGNFGGINPLYTPLGTYAHVIYLKIIVRTHTYPTDCSTGTTKVTGN